MSNLDVVKLLTLEDVEVCARMYFDKTDQSFIPSTFEAYFEPLLVKVRNKHFVRAIRTSGEIVAWIIAEPVRHIHLPYTVMQQTYYMSNATGVMAVRCVRLLHDAMLEEARRLKIGMAMSTGSFMDESNTFARILEKSGWQRRGYAAVYKLNLAEPPTVTRG